MTLFDDNEIKNTNALGFFDDNEIKNSNTLGFFDDNEIKNTNTLGFFDEEGQSFENEIQSSDWTSILTDKEKKNKSLMGILEHFATVVDLPNREDVDLILEAYKICHPYQIKNAISNVKNHPKYGKNFKRFKYIYSQVMNGRFQTRAKNNLKDNKKNKVNNQTDIGFKNSDRGSFSDNLKKITENGGVFDFDMLNNF